MGIFQNLVVDALACHFPRLRESLRVNLLRGKLHLEDVDVAPSFLIVSNLPLQLNHGKIGSLSVQVPWTKLYSSPIRAQAEDFRLSLSEVPFPSSQQEVFEAFASEAENEKKRQLAEGERGKSPLSRVLARFLPMLLDRFELDIKNVTIELKFASGQLGIIRLNELSTKPTPHAANRADLEKLVIASGVSFTITSQTTHPELCFSETSISFNATYRGGAWRIGLDIPIFKLEVDFSFPHFLKGLSERSLLWHTAYLHQRPNEAVQDNPRSWLQYAVRRVTSVFCKRRIYFSEAEARRKARSFVWYKELHVKRLRRITSADEAVQILELESALGADAILILRDQARKHALADEVSSFATRDWLGWALLGTDVSREQEHVAEELKHSLTVAKYGQASSASQEVSDLSTTWSKIRFGINIPFFRIAIADELSNMSFDVRAISMQAELDSSLESYNGSLCIGNAKLVDGERIVWVGGVRDDTHRHIMKDEEELNFLELKLYKLGYEAKVTRSLAVQSSSAVLDFMTEDGFERMRRIAAFAKSMRSIYNKTGDESNKPLRTGNLKTAEVDDILHVKTCVKIARFTLLVGRTVQEPQRSSLNICCCLSDGYAEIESGDIEKSFQRGTLAISGHRPLLSTTGSIESKPATCSEWSEKSKSFEVTASLRIDAVENRVELDVADGTGFLELSSTAPLINIMSDIQHQFLKVAPQFDDGLRDGIDEWRETHTNEDITFVLTAPLVDFRLRDSDEEGKITEAARLKLGGIKYEAEGWRYHMIRAQRLEMYEALYRNSILLVGSEIAIDVNQREGFGCLFQRVESEIDELRVSVSVQGLSTITSIVNRAFEGLQRPSSNDVALHGKDLPDQTSFEYGMQATFSFSVRLRKTTLGSAGYDIRLHTTIENVLLSRQDNMLTGFVDNLEVKTSSDSSSQYKTLVRCVIPQEDGSPRRKAISFVTSNRTSNIQVSALQIVWLKSVISSTSRMHRLLERTVNDICTKIFGTSPDHMSKEGAPELHQTLESGPLTIQGWDLTVIFPPSAASSEAVCISSSHITATVSPKGQVISVRGGQILTRTDSSQEQASTDRSRDGRVNRWVVLVREIDTDFSHHSDVQSMPSEHKRKIRDKWSIEILRRVSLLIAPSQILVLQRFISNTFSVDKTSLASGEVEQTQSLPVEDVRESACRNFSQEEGQLHKTVSIEDCSLECETHHISVELLVETATTNTAPTSIANINLDPTKLSWKRSSKYSGTACETMVISWRLTSTSIGLEDRTNEDPGTRRMILYTRQDTDDSRSFHELGNGVQAPKTALRIEAIERTDSETKTTSSNIISFHRAQVVVCPTLFQALKNFWDQCSQSVSLEDHGIGDVYEAGRQETHKGSSAAGKDSMSTSVEVHPVSRHLENDLLRVPASKVTLLFRDTNVLLLSGVEGGRNPVVNIAMESARVVLLNNHYGFLLEGSTLKVKEMSVTLLRYSKKPQSTDSQRRTSFTWNLPEHSSELDHYDYGNTAIGESSASPFPGQASRSSLPHRWHSDQTPNRSATTSLESTETLLHLQSMSIKLPSFEQNRIALNIPDVAIDCSLESLIYFALLCPDLELTPPQETPAETFPDREVLRSPDIETIIGNVSLRARLETTAVLLSEHESVHNHATIRLTGHGRFLITENFSAWNVSIKAGGDVVDEEKGICDPILSPSTLSIEANTLDEMYTNIGAQHFIRIALSPLTVRTVTGVGFTVLKVMEKYKTRIVETQNSFDEETGVLNGMRVHLSLPGFVIRCFAEQPRAQLLRLVFRDVECFVHLPTVISDEGKAELSVRDIILEDTISPHLQESGIRESRSRSSCTIVTSAHDVVRLVHRPLFLLETDSAQFSSLPRHQSPHGPPGSNPVLFCLLSWYPPFEQVSAQIGGTGLDISIDLGILPTFEEWLETLAHEYAAVQRAQHYRYRSKSRSHMIAEVPSLPLGIDHIVVEPLRIKISVTAPPSDLEPSLVQRALSWIISAESADGMIIDLPKVVFTGDFSSTQQFLDTFRSSYMRALLSRHIFKQIVRQAPQLTRLGRVLATSWARRRSRLALITGKERPVKREGPAPSATRDVGLIGALTRVQYGLATHIREVHDVQSTEDEGLEPTSRTQLSSGDGHVLQTIDITDSRHPTDTGDEGQDGKSLFLWLRANDHRIPRNERFENRFSFSPSVSMLMTSRFLLFVNRSIRAIQEPIITRANIAEYYITGPRITIVTVLSDSMSPARFAARQRERDSPSLARYLRASPRISQIQMHEIECTSPQYASWLLQQLPQQNDALRSRLYRSR